MPLASGNWNIGAGISTGQLCVVDFRSCLVAGNSNDTPGGSWIAAGIQFGYDTDGTVESCTIVGNRAYDRGAGIHVANDCNLTITRTILWGNCIGAGLGESAYVLSDGQVDFVCCDIDPATVTGGTTAYTSSLAVDPQFCAPEACANAPTAVGDYTLNGASPLLSAPGCGLIGRSGAACGVLGVALGVPARGGVEVRCAPNPFRHSTTIHYALPEAGPVEVELFDAAGRSVMRFDDGHREAGSHTIAWNGLARDGSRVAAGVFFVRVGSRGRAAGDWIVRVD